MKVVYFEKEQRIFGRMTTSHSDCFYIPDKSLVLLSERVGPLGIDGYGVIEEGYILEEAKRIAHGKRPKTSGVSFSGMQEFEYTQTNIEKLIKDTKDLEKAKKAVDSGFMGLKSHIKE